MGKNGINKLPSDILKSTAHNDSGLSSVSEDSTERIQTRLTQPTD